MKLVEIAERPDWQEKAENFGFDFHTMHGEPYWDETGAYALSLDEVENEIEDPSTELHEMALEAAGEIVRDDALMTRMAIPESAFDLIRNSWAKERDAHLYGRFDLCYGGEGPARLFEYNADTPTSLYEAAVFQWGWLEDAMASGALPEGSDQFNGIWEALVQRWPSCVPDGERDVHFAGDPENPEDAATLRVLSGTAEEAGYGAHDVALTAIGFSDEDRRFLDGDDRIIGTLFKLYPWEDLVLDEFAGLIPSSKTRFIEPAWKMLLSNKGLMAVMWRMFEGHPNLLPCLFEDEMGSGSAFAARTRKLLDASGTARKPVLSREGANVVLTAAGGRIVESQGGQYGRFPHVIQGLCSLPDFSGRRPVIGSWIIGDECVGMGIRDDASAITGDLSRFRPHYIQA